MSDEKLNTEIRQEQMAAVARRVGLVPSGIYRHFRGKEEIIDAVLDLLERRVGEIIRAAAAASPDPLERLRRVLMSHARFIREGRAIPRFIFSDEVHMGQPGRKARVHQILTGYLGHLGGFIRQGQQEGRIRQDLSPDTLALMLFGIVVPGGILWHLTDGGFDVTKHAERAWRVFADSMAPQEG
jgi:AcrR family transcriptional regulator